MSLRLLGREASAPLNDCDIELEYAMRADPQGRLGILIGDLEMVAQILLPTEFAGFRR